ncbi:MAG: hypothetical protein ACJ763_01490 [Bdellovibrionia bacterium]
MSMSEKTKFRATLVAALGTATFVAIGVSAQTGAGGGSVGAPEGLPGVKASPGASPTASPTVSPSPASAGGATGSTTRQVYSAVLNPANGSGATGTVTVVVDQGRIGAMVQASNLAPDVVHEMHIHQGTACANISADVNGDGVVDAVEAEAISGPPIIPLSLSGDIAPATPQASASMVFPTAAADGVLNYINGGSSAFLSSLPAPGTASPQAGVAATPSVSPTISPTASGSAGSANLALSGRVVEIHGVSPTTLLPNTAASDVSGMTPQQTLGVACGVLVPLTE